MRLSNAVALGFFGDRRRLCDNRDKSIIRPIETKIMVEQHFSLIEQRLNVLQGENPASRVTLGCLIDRRPAAAQENFRRDRGKKSRSQLLSTPARGLQAKKSLGHGGLK